MEKKVKRRAFGSAFLFLLASCGPPELTEASRLFVQRYAAADCIAVTPGTPPRWNGVIHPGKGPPLSLQGPAGGALTITELPAGETLTISDFLADIRMAPDGDALFLRTYQKGNLRSGWGATAWVREYGFAPFRLRASMRLRPGDLPAVCPSRLP
jgi:hypothetical protein